MARKEWHEVVIRRVLRALKVATAEELTELYLAGDFDVQGAAFRAFLSRPADSLAQGLALAASPDAERRAAACWLMAIGDRTGSVDVVIERLLGDHEERVVNAALQAFGTLQVQRSHREFGRRIRAQQENPSLTPWPEPLESRIDLAPLIRFVRHPGPGIRMQLAMSLMMCGDERATGMLVLLAGDEDEDVRSAAMHSLGWKCWTGGVTLEVTEALSRGTRDSAAIARADAVCAFLRLRQAGAEELYAAEIGAALGQSARHAPYPLVNMLYDPLSGCLPDDVREEACRRWAKGLVGKAAPRSDSAKEVTEDAPGG